MLLETYEAAATALVGVDLARNERVQVSSRNRTMRGIAVVGSAAINDCAVDAYIENAYLGRYRNSRAGVVAIVIPDDVKPTGSRAVPAGSKISLIVAIAPTTNPIIVGVF